MNIFIKGKFYIPLMEEQEKELVRTLQKMGISSREIKIYKGSDKMEEMYSLKYFVEELEKIKTEIKELSPNYEDNRPHRIWDSDVLNILDNHIKELKGE